MLGRFFRSKRDAPAAALADAIAHHEAGRLAEAAALYRQLLAQEPRHVDALHLSGVLALQQGDAGRAAELIGRSLEVFAGNAHARFNLGRVFQSQGRLDDALAQYRLVLELDPGHAPACYNLGMLCRQLGRRAEALAHFEKAVALDAEFTAGHYGLGHLLREEDRLEDAAACFRRALQLRPDHAEARWSLAMCTL